MDREDVNALILEEVDDIDDDQIRKFIDDVLRFERSELNKEQPRYKEPFKEFLNDYVDQWDHHSFDD